MYFNFIFLQDSLVVSSTSMERQSKDNQNEEDMISDLSDDVLIHILSSLNTKKAVQTSILSKRWTNLWKTLPMLILSTRNFSTEESFQEFASQILSLRDDSTSIHTLCFHHTFNLKASLFQRIVKYAISHNVQHLLIDISRHITDFPSFFFSCHTLTSLDLFGLGHTIFPNSLNSPSLTNLSLRYFAFRCNDDGFVDPFSTLKMLNTLLIAGCKVLGAQNLCISSTKLINLTIMYPQKESESSFGIELYAPSLHTFAFTGRHIQKLFGSKLVFSSIKHVNIDLLWPWESNLVENSPIILSWLVELVNIESLTVCSNTLRVLYILSSMLLFILYLIYFKNMTCMKLILILLD